MPQDGSSHTPLSSIPWHRTPQQKALLGRPSHSDPGPVPNIKLNKQGVALFDPPVYQHSVKTSSPEMEVEIRCPHADLTYPQDNRTPVRVPIFGARDSIGGTVVLNPQYCPWSNKAKLTVSIEGALIYERGNAPPPGPSYSPPRRRQYKHIFLFSSQVVDIAPPAAEKRPGTVAGRAGSSKSLRAAIGMELKRGLSLKGGKAIMNGVLASKNKDKGKETVSGPKERTSMIKGKTSLDQSSLSREGEQNGTPPHTNTFLFNLPLLVDGELPPSFVCGPEEDEDAGVAGVGAGGGANGRFSASPPPPRTRPANLPIINQRVEYKVRMHWSGTFFQSEHWLDCPFLFEPGSDKRSWYSLPRGPREWSESTLRRPSSSRDLPIPFKCVLTLPTPHIFERGSPIPFFVGFTLSPKSKSPSTPGNEAREISSDAQVRVSLICRFTLDHAKEAAKEIDGEPNGIDGKGSKHTYVWHDPPTSPLANYRKLGRKLSSKLGLDNPAGERPPPVPPKMPTGPEEEEVVVLRDVVKGFPNRPRAKSPTNDVEGKGKGREGTQKKRGGGPDRIYRSQLELTNEIMPSVDYSGISVRYFLEAVVKLHEDEVKTTVEVRIVEPHSVRPERPRRPTMGLGDMDGIAQKFGP